MYTCQNTTLLEITCHSSNITKLQHASAACKVNSIDLTCNEIPRTEEKDVLMFYAEFFI